MAMDGRRVIVGAAGSKPTIVKQPNEAFKIIFDFNAWLDGRGTLSSAVVTVEVDGGDEPTLSGGAVLGSRCYSVLVSAGTDGYNGTLKIVGTCSNSEIKEQEVDFFVTEKS